MLGELYHVGIAVRSVGEAIARLSVQGITGWGPVWNFRMPSPYKDADGLPELQAVFALAGPITLELIAPVAGRSPISAHLDQYGEGLQHLGYRVADVAKSVGLARKHGMEVEWEISDSKGPGVVYMSGGPLLGVQVELVRAQPLINLTEWLRT
jgi:hypothetical protein